MKYNLMCLIVYVELVNALIIASIEFKNKYNWLIIVILVIELGSVSGWLNLLDN